MQDSNALTQVTVTEPVDTSMLLPMSESEQQALHECEAIIKSGKENFLQVMKSLARIKRYSLFRGSFVKFSEYMEVKWPDIWATGVSSHLFQIADVALSCDEKGIFPGPANHKDVMALQPSWAYQFTADQKAEVWQIVLKEAEITGQMPTRTRMKQIADSFVQVNEKLREEAETIRSKFHAKEDSKRSQIHAEECQKCESNRVVVVEGVKVTPGQVQSLVRSTIPEKISFQVADFVRTELLPEGGMLVVSMLNGREVRVIVPETDMRQS